MGTHGAGVDRDLPTRFVDRRRDHPHLPTGVVRVPLRDQRQNRLQTVFHGPYRSGRSRHDTPVLALNNIPLITSRSSTRGRPFAPETGNNGCHRSSNDIPDTQEDHHRTRPGSVVLARSGASGSYLRDPTG